MMKASISKIVAKLTTDNIFRSEFKQDPELAINRAGYSIDDEELLALMKIMSEDFDISIKQETFNFQTYGPGPGN